MATLISIGEIFDKSIDHYRAHYKELLSIALWILLTALPSILFQYFSPAALEAESFNPLRFLWLFVLPMIALLAFNGVITVWATIALTKAVDHQAKKTAYTVKGVQKESWKLFWPYFWVCILVALIGLAGGAIFAPGPIMLSIGVFNEMSALQTIGVLWTILGAFALLAFFIWMNVSLGFWHFTLVLQGKRGVRALKESLMLVKGRFWATLIRLLVPGIVFSLLLFLANMLLMGILFAIGMVAGAASGTLGVFLSGLSSIISILLAAAATPLLLLVPYYVYDSLVATRSGANTAS